MLETPAKRIFIRTLFHSPLTPFHLRSDILFGALNIFGISVGNSIVCLREALSFRPFVRFCGCWAYEASVPGLSSWPEAVSVTDGGEPGPRII